MSQYDVSALGATTCGPFTDPITKEVMYICSPRHVLMNVGFMVAGLLMILGSVLTRTAWPRRRLSQTALLMIAIAGLGEILSGVAPGNVSVAAHAAGALLHWIFGTAGIVCLGFAVRKSSPIFASFSLFSAALVVTAFFLYGNHAYLGLGRGGMQRLLSYPLSIWLIVAGFVLLLFPDRQVFGKQSRDR